MALTFPFTFSPPFLGTAFPSYPILPVLENEGTPDLFPMPSCGNGLPNPFRLEEASLSDMQTAMSNGSLTSVELTLCYLQRTQQTQPYLATVIETNPDALAIAAAMDLERTQGKTRSPLHGIPFTVKDNIATSDSMETTAGSYALLGIAAVSQDAFVVAKLRQAGAVLVGKAGLSEWADMRSSMYSEGYSARGGQVRSAYNLSLNPGGSSSGSGVGVGANAIAFSLGTETDGSVINPAMRNAVVGLKPTVGLTSRANVIPESEHFDSVGILAKKVTDVGLVLDVIYGVDENDNYTNAQIGNTPPPPPPSFPHNRAGYASFVANKSTLQHARFGLPWRSFWACVAQVDGGEEQLDVLQNILSLLQQAGVQLVNSTATEILGWEETIAPKKCVWDWGYKSEWMRKNESEYTVVQRDFYRNLKTYLADGVGDDGSGNGNGNGENNAIITSRQRRVNTLEDVVRYNEENAGTEGGIPGIHPAFESGQDVFLDCLDDKGRRDETYWQALGYVQGMARRGIDSALGITPPPPPSSSKRSPSRSPPPPLDGLLVPVDQGLSYQVAAQAGYPIITIPAGTHSVSGMPFGLGIMHSAWEEGSLIHWASAIEDLIESSKFAAAGAVGVDDDDDDGDGDSQMTGGRVLGRTRPTWRGWRERKLPVPFTDY